MFWKRAADKLVAEGMQAYEYFTWVGARMDEANQEWALPSRAAFESWQRYVRERDSHAQTNTRG